MAIPIMAIPATISAVASLASLFGAGKGKPVEQQQIGSPQAQQFQNQLMQYLQKHMGQQQAAPVNDMQNMAMSMAMGRYGGGQQWTPPSPVGMGGGGGGGGGLPPGMGLGSGGQGFNPVGMGMGMGHGMGGYNPQMQMNPQFPPMMPPRMNLAI